MLKSFGEADVGHQPEAAQARQVLLELALRARALRRRGEELRRLLAERHAALLAASHLLAAAVEARQQQRELPHAGGHVGGDLGRGARRRCGAGGRGGGRRAVEDLYL